MPDVSTYAIYSQNTYKILAQFLSINKDVMFIHFCMEHVSGLAKH